MKQNDKGAGKVDVGFNEGEFQNKTSPIIVNQDQHTESFAFAPEHMNYHREPGLKESKFFHGPFLAAGGPEVEEHFPLQIKNNGRGRMEVEVFEDAKENGDSSSEEWDKDDMIEGEGPQVGLRRTNA
jgi:hypothetical protein